MASSRPPRPVIGLMLPTIANTDSGCIEPGRLLEAARRAERGGFDGVYVGDHLLHPGPMLEAMVSLSAVAAVTERVSIGTCVMLVALRDPLWLARQFGTLDAFAPGRLRIGIGLGGEYPGEFEAAGVALPERGRRTEHIIRQLRGLFAGELAPVADSGDITLKIAPLPAEPVPILLAGWKEVALKRAAALADGWIGYLLSAESFARRRSFLLERRAALGRGAFITGMLLPVHLDTRFAGAHANAAAAWARVTKNGVAFPERLFVAGPADAIVEQLHRYWTAGCSEMMLSLVDQGDSYLAALDSMIESIVPAVRAFAADN